MSCCSKGYCNFKFPDGPPLLDNSVTNLKAQYQFLPYGTLLQEGEVVRIWMESGATKNVIIEHKINLSFAAGEILPVGDFARLTPLPWQLIALDSGIEYQEMLNWPNHPLFNPESPPMLLVYRHPIEVKPSLKMRWLSLLYKIRNL